MRSITKALCGVILGLVLMGGVAATSVSAHPHRHVVVTFGYVPTTSRTIMMARTTEDGTIIVAGTTTVGITATNWISLG